MKVNTYVLILLFPVLLSCKEEEEEILIPWSGNLSPCASFEDKEWVVTSEIQGVSGTVLRNEYSGSSELFIIALDDEYKWKVLPCNLPEAFKIENVRVVVSGNIYSHPKKDYAYAPMELLSISQKRRYPG